MMAFSSSQVTQSQFYSMLLLTLGKLKRSYGLCLCHIKKNGQENGEAQSFLQIRPWRKLIHAERCVLASSTQWEQPGHTQGPELQDRESSLLFFHRFSCSALEGSQYVRKHTRCLSNLLSFRSQPTYVLDACAEHAASLSSDTQRHLTLRLLCMSEYAMVLQVALISDTEQSLHRSCMPCDLFQGDRKERLYISF